MDSDLVLYSHGDLNNLEHTIDNSYDFIHDNDYLDSIFDAVDKKYSLLTSEQPISIERHRQVILDISDDFRNFKNLSQTQSDIGIISHELNALESHISELVGIFAAQDVLSSVFNNFCIGK